MNTYIVNTPKKTRANFLRTNTQANSRVGPKPLVRKKRRFRQLDKPTLQSRVINRVRNRRIPTTTRPPAIAGTSSTRQRNQRDNACTSPPVYYNECKNMNKPRLIIEKQLITSLPLITRRAPPTPPPDTPPRHPTPARTPRTLPAQYTPTNYPCTTNKVESTNVTVVELGPSKADLKKVSEVPPLLAIKVPLVGDKTLPAGPGIPLAVERLVRTGTNFLIKKVTETFVKKAVKPKLGVESIDVTKQVPTAEKKPREEVSQCSSPPHSRV